MNEAIAQGGGALLTIGACSVLAGAIILERLVALRRSAVMPSAIVDVVEAYDNDTPDTVLLPLCKRHPSAFARIIATIVRGGRLSHEHGLEKMRAAGRLEVDRLERGLTLLEIIAAVSPLLGLLGTVLGMREVFNVITIEGLGDAQVLSDGIAKALITTIAGLSVAIPALAVHSLLVRRVNTLAAEMQHRAIAFLVRLQSAENNGADHQGDRL